MCKTEHAGNHATGKNINNLHSGSIENISNAQLLEEIDHLFENSTDANLDVARIEDCLSKLQERAPVMEDYDPAQTWEKFQTDHPLLFESENAQKQSGKVIEHFKRPRKLLRVVAIAAVMLFALVISANALGFRPVTKIIEWSKETFVLRVKSSGEMKLPESERVKYRTLREAVESDGYNASFCPSWIPKDYSASAINRVVSDKAVLYYAEYSSERGTLLMTAQLLTVAQTDAVIEKDDSVIEYFHEDALFYIYTNTGVPCAVWQQNNFLCSLDGDVTEEELYKILNSIF